MMWSFTAISMEMVKISVVDLASAAAADSGTSQLSGTYAAAADIAEIGKSFRKDLVVFLGLGKTITLIKTLALRQPEG